ncbi:hypothetical protein KW797_04550, partial [Candidatus Parcubacteria bacterium]|nr:hypothetical protein [Candidatus Parcubacteria bacterium]
MTRYTKFFAFILSFASLAAIALPAAAQLPPLLAPLPGTALSSTTPLGGGFSTYLNEVFNIILGIAIVLSVIMIVIGGIQYLSTDAIGGKSEGKQKLQNALIGLLLALGAFLILNTINPNL